MNFPKLVKRDAAWVRLLLRAQQSENTLLLILAVAVGIVTGLGVWLFRTGIDFFQLVFRERLADGVLAPFLGAAAIVVALALGGGRLRYVRMPIKALASALSLGAGASVGPEDPSVQIGANIGSFFGQKLHLSDERVRVLVAAGGGAAIAAVFNAPIAGVFFAMEVIL